VDFRQICWQKAVDLDIDGVPDEFYHFRGEFPYKVETDRNRERPIDARMYYSPYQPKPKKSRFTTLAD
jgi:hypothetical protein